MSNFHNVVFPIDISLNSQYEYQYETIINNFASGVEYRSSKWSKVKRVYNVGTGIKRVEQIRNIINFFQARKGSLYGFLWRDRFYNATNNSEITAFDQYIAAGDGSSKSFQLVHNISIDNYDVNNKITKPKKDSIKCGINNQEIENNLYEIDYDNGIVTFATAPSSGDIVTAGFEYYIPVRFADDNLSINMSHFLAGQSPSINLIEIFA